MAKAAIGNQQGILYFRMLLSRAGSAAEAFGCLPLRLWMKRYSS